MVQRQPCDHSNEWTEWQECINKNDCKDDDPTQHGWIYRTRTICDSLKEVERSACANGYKGDNCNMCDDGYIENDNNCNLGSKLKKIEFSRPKVHQSSIV